MRTIKILIEVEVDESPDITPEVIRKTRGNYQDYHARMMDPDSLEQIAHERSLLAALRADPVLYDEFMRANVISRLEGLSGREIFALANIKREDYQVLEDLIPVLDEPAKTRFSEAVEDGLLSEAIYLISECFAFSFKSIAVLGTQVPGSEEAH